MQVSLKRFAAIEQDRYWAIVNQCDLHVGLEHPLPYLDTGGYQVLAVILVEMIGLGWWRGGDETRTSAAAYISQQCELADYQHCPLAVEYTAVHQSGVVGKDPQTNRLVGKVAAIEIRVALLNSQKY